LENLARKYRDRPVKILLINLKEEPEQVTAFMQKNNYQMTVLLDRDGAVSRNYMVFSIPSAYLVDRSGRLALISSGYRDWNSAQVDELLDGLLAGEQHNPLLKPSAEQLASGSGEGKALNEPR